MSIRQVDISGKEPVLRVATAEGRIRLRAETVRRIREGRIEKGDPVALAKVAAILAAKQTPSLLPLCHPLRLEHTQVDVGLEEEVVSVKVTVTAHERTGVEMEALTATCIALLNIWDAVKAYEKDEQGQYPWTAIEGVRVVRKEKGHVGA
ncbi:MAG: cyclic pyranopterin monophosphate synthase MoaC [Nitrososphaerota archaeon]